MNENNKLGKDAQGNERGEQIKIPKGKRNNYAINMLRAEKSDRRMSTARLLRALELI
jgi:hypothetical protein